MTIATREMSNKDGCPEDTTPPSGEIKEPEDSSVLQNPAAALAGLTEGPAVELARQIAEARATLNDLLAPATIEALKRPLLDASVAASVAEFATFRPDPNIAKAVAAISNGSNLYPGIAKVIQEFKQFEEATAPMREMAQLTQAIAGQEKLYREIATQMQAYEAPANAIREFARVNQWATNLGQLGLRDIDSVFAKFPIAGAEVKGFRDAALQANLLSDSLRSDAIFGFSPELADALNATKFKMSAFAALTDIYGDQSRASTEAYRSIFGEWRTHPGLPDDYWRDPLARHRMYDAAGVDSGLSGADLPRTVEVMIGSGLTGGVSSDSGSTAMLAYGEVTMVIRSDETELDTYRVLGKFEAELRAFVSRKLSERFGPDWFKHRVDGNTAGKAKERRAQALMRDEPTRPLIDFTELGELGSIILSSKNWTEVFADAFINPQEFDWNMQKMIAARRPTMHFRPIDPVRLVEIICVVNSLAARMCNDGAWKITADSDR
jgi:hypothetical protein